MWALPTRQCRHSEEGFCMGSGIRRLTTATLEKDAKLEGLGASNANACFLHPRHMVKAKLDNAWGHFQSAETIGNEGCGWICKELVL